MTRGPLVTLLSTLNRAGPSDVLPAVVASLSEELLDVSSVALYVADLEERYLEAWPLVAGAPQARLAVSGEPHGSVYRSGETQVLPDGDGYSIVAIVSTRRDRIGVLEVRTAALPAPASIDLVDAVALVVGYLITTGDRWTDEFHLARRQRDMALAAEIQWSMLPLSTFASRHLSLSGTLEPAYDVGGDVFDYACGHEDAILGVFDAMGHGLSAARLSSLTVAAFRNARRRGDDLDEQGRFLDAVIAERFASEGYVTGVMVQIPFEAPEGSRILRAGHPHPILQRGSTTEPVEVVTGDGLPFGMPFRNDLATELLDAWARLLTRVAPTEEPAPLVPVETTPTETLSPCEREASSLQTGAPVPRRRSGRTACPRSVGRRPTRSPVLRPPASSPVFAKR